MRYLSNHSKYKKRRRELRKNPTIHEKILWDFLHNGNLGFKFRRQHSIGDYILDFYCPSKKLAIELDGNQHENNKEYDNERTHFLNDQGIFVLRISNNEIDSAIESVLLKIQANLH